MRYTYDRIRLSEGVYMSEPEDGMSLPEIMEAALSAPLCAVYAGKTVPEETAFSCEPVLEKLAVIRREQKEFENTERK